MAVSLLSNEVSDLCIGKPALTPLSLSSTVVDALLALKSCPEPYLSIWSSTKSGPTCVGKICIVDIVCFLCSDDNIASPSSALKSPVSVIPASRSSSLVRRLDPHSSILEGLDLILEGGAQNLVVPIRSSSKKKKSPTGMVLNFCCLTQEDFVRFFLNSVGLFSPVPALSISSLGIIRTEVLAVGYHDAAISAVHLLKQAVLTQTAVAVVTDDGKLIGEISPSTLAFFGDGGDLAVAGAVAALTAGELMAYIDCGGSLDVVVKERLKLKGLSGMVELMEEEEEKNSNSNSVFSSSSSGTSSSSSSDEESSPQSLAKRRNGSGTLRKYSRSGSYSARMGRRSEEAIVCHPGSSLVAVMMQALAHRVSYIWVVEEDYELVGVVVFPDVLRVLRDHLLQ